MYYFIEYYKYKWIQSRGRMVNKLPIRSILQILLGAEKNKYLSFKILLLLSFFTYIFIQSSSIGDRYNFKTAKNHRSVTYRHNSYMSHCSCGY